MRNCIILLDISNQNGAQLTNGSHPVIIKTIYYSNYKARYQRDHHLNSNRTLMFTYAFSQLYILSVPHLFRWSKYLEIQTLFKFINNLEGFFMLRLKVLEKLQTRSSFKFYISRSYIVIITGMFFK